MTPCSQHGRCLPCCSRSVSSPEHQNLLEFAACEPFPGSREGFIVWVHCWREWGKVYYPEEAWQCRVLGVPGADSQRVLLVISNTAVLYHRSDSCVPADWSNSRCQFPGLDYSFIQHWPNGCFSPLWPVVQLQAQERASGHFHCYFSGC